jgi:hypothetical protein
MGGEGDSELNTGASSHTGSDQQAQDRGENPSVAQHTGACSRTAAKILFMYSLIRN